MTNRNLFQQHASTPDLSGLADAVYSAKRGEASGQLAISEALAWVAFSCPGATDHVYDAITSAWLDKGDVVALPEGLAAAPLENSFWQAYWSVIEGAEQGYDAASITAAVATLGGAVHSDFGLIAEQQACAHSGAAGAEHKDVPGMTDIGALAGCPPDSLGKALYDLLTLNGFDPEVLDRDAILLNQLPPALCYLNTRILQMHDVWHLVAGYETTGTQEVAISSFQLAQFGHNYSSMFLAIVSMISHERNPRGFGVLMQLITEAWLHGRETPALMAIDWENEWHSTLPEIRQRYGIKTFQTQLPPNLMETFSEGTTWQKLKLGWKLVRFSRELRAAV